MVLSKALIPIPTMRAVGVASPRAQGQAITSIATVAKVTRVTTPNVGLTQERLNLSVFPA